MTKEIFAKTAPAYFKAKLNVIPMQVEGKRPVITDWINYAKYKISRITQEKWIRNFPNNNIGILAGKKNGVIFVDIETEHADLKEKLVRWLNPKSPWCRVNGRGVVFAYKYSGEKPGRHTVPGVASVNIYSDGNVLLLPPSVRQPGALPFKSNKSLISVIDKLQKLDAICLPALFTEIDMYNDRLQQKKGKESNDSKNCFIKWASALWKRYHSKRSA